MADSFPRAICLTGPTASGKTEVAVSLVRAFDLEIISVDSAMIYRGMNVGTAKPDAQKLRIAPHRLIDIHDPWEPYSAGQFRRDAIQAMSEILAAGRTPLLVGGTMLYFRSLLKGLAALPGADPAVRADIDARAQEQGWPALHERLGQVDPEAAQRISPNDAQRIQRALEVWELTGQTLSEHQAEQEASAPFEFFVMALLPTDRAVLNYRIGQRFAAMMEAGFLDEVKSLRGDPRINPELPAMRAVGYRQLWKYLDGECSLDEALSQAVAATRRLAKRQMTWLRSMPLDARIDCLAANPAAEARRLVAAGPLSGAISQTSG